MDLPPGPDPSGPMCATCDPYDVEVAIHGAAQLRRIVAKLRAAVEAGSLVPDDPGRNAPLIDQPTFTDLDLRAVLPDHLQYEFGCASCGARFSLDVETYHGQGGRWARL